MKISNLGTLILNVYRYIALALRQCILLSTQAAMVEESFRDELAVYD